MEKFTIDFKDVEPNSDMGVAFEISTERQLELVKLLNQIPIDEATTMLWHLGEGLKLAKSYNEAIWITWQEGLNFGRMVTPPMDDFFAQMLGGAARSEDENGDGEVPSFLTGKA